MRQILISMISTLFLFVLALALIPFFVSTDFLKSQVEQFVKDQTDLRLAIEGDVSLSILTGLALSADTVSLNDAADKPLFAVDRLDFALALAPLLSGKADITGITLNKPVVTLAPANPGGADTASQATPSQSTSPRSTAAQTNIDLSALKIRRVTIKDGQLTSLDDGGHKKDLLSGLDLTLRIPDFNSAASFSGTLPYLDQEHDFIGTIANASAAINGKPTRMDLNVTSDLLKARLEGMLSLNDSQILGANYSVNVDNVTQLLAWLGLKPSPVAVGKLTATGSVQLGQNRLYLPSLSLALDDQSIEGAAKIFTGADLQRPMIRVALDASTLNLDRLLATPTATNKAKASEGTATTASPDNPPDLAFLTQFDLTVDARAGRVTLQGKSIRQFKLIAQLIDGQLKADLKSANVAKGNLQANLNGDIPKLIWNGTIKARKLEIEELARLVDQNTPLTGAVSTDLNFAAQGLDLANLGSKGNLAGVVTLDGGTLTHPALQSALPGKESGNLKDLTSRVTINSLDDPVDITGSFRWNGETINYASTIGLGEMLASQPMPVSFSADAPPVSIGLTGLFDPAKTALSGSKLSVRTSSSRRLLGWLGQTVNDGTPDLPVTLSTGLSLAGSQTRLTNLSLAMGQSKGSGEVTFATAARPSLTGRLAFEILDLTPFMGDGTASGRTAANAASTQSSGSGGSAWDDSPIDFSGLNDLDANLTLSTRSLIARDIVTGPVTLVTRLNNGQLNGSLDDLNLYGGRGTGGFGIDARKAPASMSANFALSGLQMDKFLTDSIDLAALSGTGGLSLDLQTTGSSQAQIIQALNGSGKIDIRDGQIRGINIPQMLRNLQGSILEGWASSDSQATDFSSMTASFQISNGIVQNSDLLMQSPLLRLSGTGSVNLPNKTIAYRTTPKLTSNLEGQGGLVDANGVPIPIIIKGQLTKPRIYPDIPGILENPNAILKGLEQLGGGGKAASKGIKKIEKTVTKEIQKQTEKLGIDLNQLVNPQSSQQSDQPQQGSGQQQQQPPQNLEQKLFQGITKGLFGN